MERTEIVDWNRNLVVETAELLEKTREEISDAVSRLRGLLAVNPGGPTVPPVQDANNMAAAEINC